MSAEKFDELATDTVATMDELAAEWLERIADGDSTDLITHLGAHSRLCGYLMRLLERRGVSVSVSARLTLTQSLAGHLDAGTALARKGAN